MSTRPPAIALAPLAFAALLLTSCASQARSAGPPEATAAADRGSAHLRITQVTVGTAFPVEGFVIKLGPGVYRLTSWQSICDGNCGNLDAPSKPCERALSVRGGELLQATVRVNFASVQTPCVIVLRR